MDRVKVAGDKITKIVNEEGISWKIFWREVGIMEIKGNNILNGSIFPPKYMICKMADILHVDEQMLIAKS